MKIDNVIIYDFNILKFAKEKDNILKYDFSKFFKYFLSYLETKFKYSKII